MFELTALPLHIQHQHNSNKAALSYLSNYYRINTQARQLQYGINIYEDNTRYIFNYSLKYHIYVGHITNLVLQQ